MGVFLIQGAEFQFLILEHRLGTPYGHHNVFKLEKVTTSRFDEHDTRLRVEE